MKTVVFGGPSISRSMLRARGAADVRGPIWRGDLEDCLGYDTVVIIDGEFGQTLSVSPKEILVLLDAGKRVIGASSMGALRASELHCYGMVGIGWVYERFVRAAVRQDDDVALMYSPLDFVPITVPMVDVEHWMERMASRGFVSRLERRRVVQAARGVFFGDRGEALLLELIARIVGHERLASMLAESGGTIPDVKALDAERAMDFALGREAAYRSA